MKKVLLKKILKVCGTPEDFCFDYINGASQEADIRRMKEYVACVRKVEKLKPTCKGGKDNTKPFPRRKG